MKDTTQENLNKLKDANRIKEEAFKEYSKDMSSWGIQIIENYFNAGWDACVKCLKASPTVTIEDKEPKLTIHARKLKFTAGVIAICDNNIKITDKVFTEFIEHWTEHSPKGKQMRFEKQTFFDILKRLRTFKANDKKWNPQDTVGGEKKKEVMEGNYLNSEHFNK